MVPTACERNRNAAKPRSIQRNLRTSDDENPFPMHTKEPPHGFLLPHLISVICLSLIYLPFHNFLLFVRDSIQNYKGLAWPLSTYPAKVFLACCLPATLLAFHFLEDATCVPPSSLGKLLRNALPPFLVTELISTPHASSSFKQHFFHRLVSCVPTRNQVLFTASNTIIVCYNFIGTI